MAFQQQQQESSSSSHHHHSNTSSTSSLKKQLPPQVPTPTGDPKNPYGLGDPDDNSLRKVEKEILIPMKMRDRAKTEKCTEEVKAFTECSKAAGLAMVIKCRNENDVMKTCLTRWYRDDTFKAECTQMYLEERSEYRRTGVKQKYKKYLA